jgi:hypothetical protein
MREGIITIFTTARSQPKNPQMSFLGICYVLSLLCLSEIKLAHTDDEVRQEMA